MFKSFLKAWLICLFFLIGSVGYTQNLSDSIYNDLDELVKEPPSLTAINTFLLTIEERYSSLTTNDERLAMVIVHCNLGYYLKEYEKHYDAIEQYQKAWKLFHSNDLDNYDIIEYCLKPLGNLLTISGNYADAENVIREYMSMARLEGNDVAYSAGVINLSVVYYTIGNYQSALDLLEKHLEKGGVTEAQKKLIENNITTNLIALKKNEEAQRRLSQQAHKSVAGLKNQAQLLIEQKQYAGARNALEQAERLVIEENSPRQLAKFYVEKSAFYHLQEEKDRAIAMLDNALNLLLPKVGVDEIKANNALLYPENTLIDIFDGYAAYAEDLHTKLAYYDLSFYVEDLLIKQIDDPQSQLIYQTSNRKRSETCLQLLYDKYAMIKNNSLIEKALQYAEQNKTRVLKEALQRKSLIEQYPNDSLLLYKQHLFEEQQSLVGELIRTQLSDSESEKVALLNQQFIELSYEINKTQKEIGAKYSENVNRQMSLDKLQQQLKTDQAQMLYFFFGNQALYSFSIDSEEIKWKKIQLDQSFKEEVGSFIKLFENPTRINNDIQSFVRASFNLSQKLGGQLNHKIKNLVIIPDGLLNFVPFEALVLEKVAHTNYRVMPFWLKTYTIAYNTSSDFYVRNQKPIKLESFYGVFPVFKNTDRYLKYSEREAELIADKVEGAFDMNDEATKTNFLEKANSYDILHLSTHASGGNFSIPAYVEFADDALLLPEIYSQNFTAALVVLSACETGVGKLIKGATPMSLARGFQYAGVKNILMSQWEVNDFTTAELMDRFYDELFRYKSPSYAIRNASISYLDDESISNIEKSPYYWAGFSYYGKLEKEKRNDSSVRSIGLWLLAAFVILLSLYIFVRTKKKH